MAVQRGRDLLIKLKGAGEQVFTSVAGLRAGDITLNARPIDATTADSEGQWREYLARSGVKEIRISGQGLMVSAASDIALRQIFFDNQIADFEIIIPGLCRFSGPFALTQMQYEGNYDGELIWKMELASSGFIHVAPI